MRRAEALGADVRYAPASEDCTLPADRMIEMMKAIGITAGLGEIGDTENDIPGLVAGAYPQQRLFAQAQRPVGEDNLAGLYRDAMHF